MTQGILIINFLEQKTARPFDLAQKTYTFFPKRTPVWYGLIYIFVRKAGWRLTEPTIATTTTRPTTTPIATTTIVTTTSTTIEWA